MPGRPRRQSFDQWASGFGRERLVQAATGRPQSPWQAQGGLDHQDAGRRENDGENIIGIEAQTTRSLTSPTKPIDTDRGSQREARGQRHVVRSLATKLSATRSPPRRVAVSLDDDDNEDNNENDDEDDKTTNARIRETKPSGAAHAASGTGAGAARSTFDASHVREHQEAGQSAWSLSPRSGDFEGRKSQKSTSPILHAAARIRRENELDKEDIGRRHRGGRDTAAAHLRLAEQMTVQTASALARGEDRVDWQGSPRSFESKVSAAVSDALPQHNETVMSELDDIFLSQGALNRSYRKGDVKAMQQQNDAVQDQVQRGARLSQSQPQQNLEGDASSLNSSVQDSKSRQSLHIDRDGRIRTTSPSKSRASPHASFRSQQSDEGQNSSSASTPSSELSFSPPPPPPLPRPPLASRPRSLPVPRLPSPPPPPYEAVSTTSSASVISRRPLSASPLDYSPVTPPLELIRAWATWKRFVWTAKQARRRTVAAARRRPRSQSGIDNFSSATSVVAGPASTYSRSTQSSAVAAAVTDRLRAQIELALEERTRMAIRAGVQMLARSEERRLRMLMGRGFRALQHVSQDGYGASPSASPAPSFRQEHSQERRSRAGARLVNGVLCRWRSRMLRNSFTRLLRASESDLRVRGFERFKRQLAHVILIQLVARKHKLAVFRAFHKLRDAATKRQNRAVASAQRRREVLRSAFRAKRLRMLAAGFRALSTDPRAEAGIDDANKALRRTRKVLAAVRARVQRTELGKVYTLQHTGLSLLCGALRSIERRRKQRAFHMLFAKAELHAQARSFQIFRRWDLLRAERRTRLLTDSIEETCTTFAVRRLEQVHRGHRIALLLTRRRFYSLQAGMDALRKRTKASGSSQDAQSHSRLGPLLLERILLRKTNTESRALRSAFQKMHRFAMQRWYQAKIQKLGARTLSRRSRCICMASAMRKLRGHAQQVKLSSIAPVRTVRSGDVRDHPLPVRTKQTEVSVLSKEMQSKTKVATIIVVWRTWRQGALCRAFERLRTFVRSQRVLAERSAWILQGALSRWSRSLLAQGWVALRSHTESLRMQERASKQVARIVRRWQNAALARAFDSLRREVLTRKQSLSGGASLLAAAVGKWRSANLHSAFSKWQLVSFHARWADHDARAEAKTRAAIQLWQQFMRLEKTHTDVFEAFLKWKQSVNRTKRQHSLVRKSLLRMARSHQARAFQSLQRHAREQESLRRMLHKTLLRLGNLEKARAFTAWAKYSQQALASQSASHRLFRCVHRWQRTRLVAAMYQWKIAAAKGVSREAVKNAAARTVLLQWRNQAQRRCREAIQRWQLACTRAVQVERLVRRTMGRWRKLALARAFRSLAITAYHSHSRVECMRRVCRQWVQRRLRLAFCTWCARTRVAMILETALDKWKQQQCASAFARWHSQLDLETQRRILLRRLVTRALRKLALRHFRIWSASARATSRRGVLLGRVFRRWQGLRLRVAFQKLQSHTRTSQRLAHGLQMIKHGLWRLMHASLRLGWGKLQQHVVFQRRLESLFKLRHRVVLRDAMRRLGRRALWQAQWAQRWQRALLSIHHFHLRSAFSSLRANMRREAAADRAIMQWRTLRCAKAFRQWDQATIRGRQERYAGTTLRRIFRRWILQRQAKAWRKWSDLVRRDRGRSTTLAIAVKRWRSRQAARCFEQWKSFVQSRRALRRYILQRALRSSRASSAEALRKLREHAMLSRRVDLLARITKRLERRSVMSALYVWKTQIRLSMQANEHKMREIAIAAQRLKRLYCRKACRSSFTLWRRNISDQRSIEDGVRAVARALSRCTIREKRHAFEALTRRARRQSLVEKLLRRHYFALMSSAWQQLRSVSLQRSAMRSAMKRVLGFSCRHSLRLAFSRWDQAIKLIQYQEKALKRLWRVWGRTRPVAQSFMRWRDRVVLIRFQSRSAAVLLGVFSRVQTRRIRSAFMALSAVPIACAAPVPHDETDGFTEKFTHATTKLVRCVNRIARGEIQASWLKWRTFVVMKRVLVLRGFFVAWRVGAATSLSQRLLAARRANSRFHASRLKSHFLAWHDAASQSQRLSKAREAFSERRRMRLERSVFEAWLKSCMLSLSVADFSQRQRTRDTRRVLSQWESIAERHRKLRAVFTRNEMRAKQKALSQWARASMLIAQEQRALRIVLLRSAIRARELSLRRAIKVWRDHVYEKPSVVGRRAFLFVRLESIASRAQLQMKRRGLVALQSRHAMREKQRLAMALFAKYRTLDLQGRAWTRLVCHTRECLFADRLSSLTQAFWRRHLHLAWERWATLVAAKKRRDLMLQRVLKDWSHVQMRSALRRWRLFTRHSSKAVLLAMHILRCERKSILRWSFSRWTSRTRAENQIARAAISLVDFTRRALLTDALDRLWRSVERARASKRVGKLWKRAQIRQFWVRWMAVAFSHRRVVLSSVFTFAHARMRQRYLQFGFAAFKEFTFCDRKRVQAILRCIGIFRRVQLNSAVRVWTRHAHQSQLLEKALCRAERAYTSRILRESFYKLVANRWVSSANQDVSQVIDLACSNSTFGAEMALQKHVAMLAGVNRTKVSVEIALRAHKARARGGHVVYDIENRSGRIVASVDIAHETLPEGADVRVQQFLRRVGGIMGREWMNRVSRRGLQLRRCLAQRRARLLRSGFAALLCGVAEARGELAYARAQHEADVEAQADREQTHATFWERWKLIRASVSLVSLIARFHIKMSNHFVLQHAFSLLVAHAASARKVEMALLPVGLARIKLQKADLVRGFSQLRAHSTMVRAQERWCKMLCASRETALLQRCFDAWIQLHVGMKRLRRLLLRNKQTAAQALALHKLANICRTRGRRARLLRGFFKLHQHRNLYASRANLLSSFERIMFAQDERDLLRSCFVRWRAQSHRLAKARLCSMLELTSGGFEESRQHSEMLRRKVSLSMHFARLKESVARRRAEKARLLQRSFAGWARHTQWLRDVSAQGSAKRSARTGRLLTIQAVWVAWKATAVAHRALGRLVRKRSRNLLRQALDVWRAGTIARQTTMEVLARWARVAQTVVKRNALRNWHRFARVQTRRCGAVQRLLRQRGYAADGGQKVLLLRAMAIWREQSVVAQRSQIMKRRARGAHAVWSVAARLRSLPQLRDCFQRWVWHSEEKKLSDTRVAFSQWRCGCASSKYSERTLQARVLFWERVLVPRRRLQRYFEAWQIFAHTRATAMKLYALAARRRDAARARAAFAVWKAESARAKSLRHTVQRARLGRAFVYWRWRTGKLQAGRRALRMLALRRERRALQGSFTLWRVYTERVRAIMFKFVSENLSVQMVSALQNKENEMNQLQLVQQASESTLSEVKERAKRKIKSLLEDNARLREALLTRGQEAEALEQQSDEERRALKCCELQLIRAKEEAAELRRKSRVLLSASEELCQLQEYVHELEASNFDLQSRLEQAQRKAHRRDKKFKAMREEAELLQLKVHQLSYISRVERESFCSTLLSNMSMEEV